VVVEEEEEAVEAEAGVKPFLRRCPPSVSMWLHSIDAKAPLSPHEKSSIERRLEMT